jgi:two-component system LytT family response regulator
MKTACTAIIVDDERDAILGLRALLREYCPEITLCGEAESAFQALRMIRSESPGLIFLDVQMPGADGFELMEELGKESSPLVIFTTAHEQHAIRALRNDAVDYLLKPINPDELQVAVRKAIMRLKEKGSENGPGYKVKITDHEGIVFVPPADIVFLEGQGRYTKVVLLDGRTFMVVRNIGEFETELKPHRFFRIHKSYLINCMHVKKIAKNDGGFVELSNGKSIEISRRKKTEFLAFLKQ